MNRKRMKKKPPSRKTCLKLMDQHGMLGNIVNHSLEVTRIALFLCEELKKKGQRIDSDLVEAASLLHDLAKTECLSTKEDHAQQGYELLKKMGYERIGQVVAQHIQIRKEGDPSCISEEEVVNYADKRVRHDRIVSLETRFQDLKDRYGKGRTSLGQLKELEEATREIERKIFSILQIDPSDLEHLQFNPVSSQRPNRKGQR
jgi:putative nucleotidyltransferase with HDIG domain